MVETTVFGTGAPSWRGTKDDVGRRDLPAPSFGVTKAQGRLAHVSGSGDGSFRDHRMAYSTS